jgi:hypothetical protein
VYANDTAFKDFLTGAQCFTVKEIEVFEIADETALPADVEKCANGCLFRERARDAGAVAAGRLWETQASDKHLWRLFLKGTSRGRQDNFPSKAWKAREEISGQEVRQAVEGRRSDCHN